MNMQSENSSVRPVQMFYFSIQWLGNMLQNKETERNKV